MATDGELVLVTGASGFVATHVIQQLQQAGYRVRGTARDLTNEERLKPAKELCPDTKYPLELVQLDMKSGDGWKEAVKGCTYVLLVASGVEFTSKEPVESEVIGSAVDGTLRILDACREARVKRVILFGSTAAISFGKPGTFTEDDWQDPDKAPLLINYKVRMEKAAWDYMEKLADSEKFELVVIHPSFVMGPVLCGRMTTSMEITKGFLLREMPMYPRIMLTMIDVRDLAAATLSAMTIPEAVGKRFIGATKGLWFREYAEIYGEEFSPLGYKVPTWHCPWILMKVMSYFDKMAALMLPMWNKETDYDGTRMRTILKIEPRPYKETLLDTGHSMIQTGLIKKTKLYKEKMNL